MDCPAKWRINRPKLEALDTLAAASSLGHAAVHFGGSARDPIDPPVVAG